MRTPCIFLLIQEYVERRVSARRLGICSPSRERKRRERKIRGTVGFLRRGPSRVLSRVLSRVSSRVVCATFRVAQSPLRITSRHPDTHRAEHKHRKIRVPDYVGCNLSAENPKYCRIPTVFQSICTPITQQADRSSRRRVRIALNASRLPRYSLKHAKRHKDIHATDGKIIRGIMAHPPIAHDLFTRRESCETTPPVGTDAMILTFCLYIPTRARICALHRR